MQYIFELESDRIFFMKLKERDETQIFISFPCKASDNPSNEFMNKARHLGTSSPGALPQEPIRAQALPLRNYYRDVPMVFGGVK